MTAPTVTDVVGRAVSPVDGPVRVLPAEPGDGSLTMRVAFTVAPEETVLPGHYPGFPIFPGVCLVEVVHLGALATAGSLPAADAPADGRLELRQIESTRFTGPVFPGDSLTAVLDWKRDESGWRCRAKVRSQRGDAASVRLRFAAPAADPDPAPDPAPASAPTEQPTDPPSAVVADQAEIRGRLPHRFPMLLVDRVLSVEPERSLVANKAVSCNEPWYAAGPTGHGDTASAAAAFGYPGTLLVESWCQSAGVLATWESPNPDVLEGDVMLFGGMSGVEFHHPVLPGQVLEHRVRQERRVGETVMFEGESLVDGRTVMTVGRITMAFRPARVLRPETS
ncbi:3-hydroxyacyl-ACP dehydratase FabZ family protein [Streptomyces alkaliterrae]|uniref:3-hydroxyacyl-ACP dehydratase FabZ family protein n=1 Tax=Streptomyces alkaliterrae TaxID=2213162 RepID=UPI001E535DB0|nr:hypothetical protein [Streptomyces alkaliterrae]